MTDADKKDFSVMMHAIYGYYGKELSKDVIRIWWAGLLHMDLAAVRDGLNRHVANPDTGMFLPKIADVVKMGEGSSGNMALRAWSLVDHAVRSVGTYRSVTFDDPITMRVIQDMGGWIKLGQAKDPEWPFVAKEFQTRYAGFRTRSEAPECPDHLQGIAELENVSTGHPVAPVMLIGNPEKALAIRHNGNKAGNQIAYEEPTKLLISEN